ncbi:MAG: hypothetical protein NT161_01360 [Candidatus Nomurabacteria bacterium]|nr:hypothetical protein [Candidatus Nomurabacteria bacterium]
MNTYTYKCLDCKNVFGIMATIEEKEGGISEKFICPKCHSKNTKQEFSAGNFIKNVFKSNDKGGCGSGNNNGGCCG